MTAAASPPPDTTDETIGALRRMRTKIREVGAVRHLIDGGAPILAFIIGYQLGNIVAGIVAAIVTAAIIAGLRLWHGDKPLTVAISAGLILVFSAMAAATGEGRDFFLPPLILYTALTVVFGVSLATPSPLSLPICRKIRLEPQSGQLSDPADRVRFHRRLTLVWALFCLAHVMIMGPVYLANNVVLLGALALILNKPALIVAVAGTGIWVRASVKSASASGNTR